MVEQKKMRMRMMSKVEIVMASANFKIVLVPQTKSNV